ncbi:MAG: quinolinate synthase NadA [Candidatus Omnitrophica bacterium]|nr:quinolinate synthase NadA [Candidatus Omnitrophota bacterium]
MITLINEEIQNLSDQECIARIRAHKERLGRELLILAHNYQRYDIVQLADYYSDSLDLARRGREAHEAKYIVFCGVHFMAQTSRVLAAPHQRVFLPNHLAGCPLSDFAEIDQAETAWEEVTQYTGADNVVPVAYVNSTVLIKAVCGRNGGTICTSANADKVFTHYLSQGKRILFMPDEHLGNNTAVKLGIPRDEIALYDPAKENGGLAPEAIRRARVILWKGHCHVHTNFTPALVDAMRQRYPDAVVLVHPECPEATVRAADLVGSTKFMSAYVEKAEAGKTIIIGTEVNHVRNLALMNPHLRILELSRSLCPNMFKINLRNLLYTLDNLGEVNEVFVKEDVRQDALKAVNRMFEIA